MMKIDRPLALFLVLVLSPTTQAQSQEIALWPDGVPNAPRGKCAPENTQDRPEGGDRHVRNVHEPTITVYRPESQDAGPLPAVVICPGGGYGILALDKEGHDIARWLAESGVVGVVLKYRLPRPAGHIYGHEAPLADVRRALALVRENASAWSVNAARVGVMGFSAGGHLAASASVQLKQDGPDFTVLVYPVVSLLPGVGHDGSRANLLGREPEEALVRRFSSELHVTAKTPPAFLVHTSDDPVRVENSLLYYGALREAKVPAELHVFARGGHGYGMRRPDLPVGRWPELLLAWIADTGPQDR